VVLAIFLPITWIKRHDPNYTNAMLLRLLATPLVLAFVVSKAFIKSEFWSLNLAVAPFTAVRPLREEELVVNKLKVAAASVILGWLPILLFAAIWLPLWAGKTSVEQDLFYLRLLYPRSWLPLLMLAVFGLVIFTWRLMVGGLWAGLSGKALWYYGVPAMQLIAVWLVALACAIWSGTIDRFCQEHPELAHVLPIRIGGGILAGLVILKYWAAAFSWRKVTPRLTWQYLRLWLCATLGLGALALLAQPPFDMDRQVYVYFLAALWLVPLARLGIAPRWLAMNRHRQP
jgi:hypothetical protein